MAGRLRRGDQLPQMVTVPPGARSREMAETMARVEAPVVNTLYRGEPSVVWQEALGSNVLDVDGNLYIDLTAGFGVAAVGHRHPRVVAALRAQSERLVHGMGDVASHPARIELAERLGALAPIDEAAVYFAVSGADAVEIALKTAWLATGRRRVVAFEGGYHGCTLAALAVTSREEFRRPFAELLGAWVGRLSYAAPLERLERELAAGEVAAVVVEPVLGREGFDAPPEGWLRGLAEACREHGALLVVDEIFTGFGRTGYRFACEADRVTPDLLCCGKALGGGLPIAAVLGRRDLLQHWDRNGEALHTATFLAHPLACAAALTTLDIIEALDLPGRAARLGMHLAGRAVAWEDLEAVRSVRGRGLAWTVELEDARTASDVARRALDQGLLLLTADRRLQVSPPLVITEEQLDHAVGVLERSLREMSAASG